MPNEGQISILRQGVGTWNQWRQEHPQIRIDLNEADLTGANLKEANLSGGNLKEANLEGASLTGADLNEAQLTGAKLEGANLTGANLRRTRLLETCLINANIGLDHRAGHFRPLRIIG